MDFVSFKKPLFGKEIEIIVYNPPAKIKEIIEDAYKEALRLQKIFSFFDETSELSLLNKKRKLQVSPELLEVLNKSLAYSELTNGKYDVALGKEILKRKKGQDASEIIGLYKNIKINNNDVSLDDKNILLDFGSIAKGYITDKIGDFLKKKKVNEFMINSRGDILFSGTYSHIIGIQHPRDKDKNIQQLKISNCGVATSGDYKQFYGSYEKSHILNRNPNIISVTIIAKDVCTADVFASVVFVSNDDELNHILKANKEIKAFIVYRDLSQKFYNGFNDLIYHEA